MQFGFKFAATRWILGFTSKMGPWVGLPHPQGVTPDQKYWAWSTCPMDRSNHPSLVKIGDIEVCRVFGSCVDILLSKVRFVDYFIVWSVSIIFTKKICSVAQFSLEKKNFNSKLIEFYIFLLLKLISRKNCHIKIVQWEMNWSHEIFVKYVCT